MAELKKIQIKNRHYIVGGLSSPLDIRDYKAETIYPKEVTLPAKLDLRKDLLPIRDQGPAGTCVAMASATLKEWQEGRQINLYEYFSPQFIYNQRENQNSEGMYCRDALRVLKNIGCCVERLFPYGSEERNQAIPSLAIEDAGNFKISGYAGIFTIEALKKALVSDGPCLILMPIYDQYADDLPWKAIAGARIVGAHVMCVVGYDGKGFLIRNSWGEDWGNKGYCIFPYSEWGIQMETWTMIDSNSSKGNQYIYHNNYLKRLWNSVLSLCQKHGKIMIFMTFPLIVLTIALIIK